MKRKTETNTLSLIRRWSMAGEVGDLSGRFGSLVDIHAMVSRRDAAPSGDTLSGALAPVLMKPADEDDWQPLLNPA